MKMTGSRGPPVWLVRGLRKWRVHRQRLIRSQELVDGEQREKERTAETEKVRQEEMRESQYRNCRGGKRGQTRAE